MILSEKWRDKKSELLLFLLICTVTDFMCARTIVFEFTFTRNEIFFNFIINYS